MGECAYYLKAEFPTEKEAQKAETLLDEFFAEAREAYEYWQHGRESEAKEFWKEFTKKYPRVFEYVKTLPEYDPDSCDPNSLSGKMDFGQDENNEVLRQGNVLGWGDCNVWHFADWEPLAQFIQKKFKALKVVWNTEENGCGSLDSLQLYDWEQIVKDLLKHKEIYPMLIGINDDLNTMIDIKSKGVNRGKKKSL